MKFLQVDVFTEEAYTGNPLAVFPDASELDAGQMQSIAREMNLSESIFVQAVDGDAYNVRIFTPTVELPFAGHPTIGCAWVLRSRGVISSNRVTQRSEAGETPIWFDGPVTWLRRTGTSDEDIERTDPEALSLIADALAIETSEIGAEVGDFASPRELRPAFADAGLRQLMVPVRDLEVLQRCSPRADLFADLGWMGAYCFTPTGRGEIRARGLWPSAGIVEDPATGVAAAGLGLYLVARAGAIEVAIRQGIEIGRPSTIYVRADGAGVEVGGRCAPVVMGTLEQLP